MSFPTSRGGVSSPFELVRRSLTQHDVLPFSDALTAEQIEEAFQAEQITFGKDVPNVVYTQAVTLWATLSQALYTGFLRYCRASVIRVAAYYAILGVQISTNTGAYSRARAKIGEAVVRRLICGVSGRSEAAVPEGWKWKGMTVRMVDGTTFSMPDTEENQAEYPQSSSQRPGLGFPILRAVALVSLATGMVSDLAVGPYSGKETGETALFRELFDSLKRGEVIVADRYFCGWFMLALLRELGVHFIVRMHQLRHYDFRRGQRLGNRDHVVSWKKPVRPKWMSPEVYASLPAELQVRETHVSVGIAGFRVESLVAVSSFLDDDLVEATDIADLYHQRWRAELHLREIKSYMELDVLRAMTPEMVRQELQMGILAYNLVRQSMQQTAIVAGKRPHQLSFTVTLQTLTTIWLIAAIPPGCTITETALATLRLITTALHLVGNRPDRIEPRKIKRRHSAHDHLTVPRKHAIADLLKGLVS